MKTTVPKLKERWYKRTRYTICIERKRWNILSFNKENTIWAIWPLIFLSRFYVLSKPKPTSESKI